MAELEIDEWITIANDRTYINLTRGGEDVFEESFSPVFTYPIFGEEERIIGYKDPVISLRFRSHDLKPSVNIRHNGKIPPPTDEIAEKMDLDAQLKEFLPHAAWEKNAKSDDPNAESWQPPGKKLHSYVVKGKRFEIWCASLLDDRARDILANMRIFISFYIEGGTCNFLDDPAWSLDRWKIFLVYEVFADSKPNASPYALAGFGTSYKNWVAASSEVLSSFPNRPPPGSDLNDISFLSDAAESEPDSITSPSSFDPLKAPSRERISQFLVLPPYQHQSHGTHLYNTMTKVFLDDAFVFEITVEDPSEAFDDLRDYCDLARLMPDPDFSELRLPTTLDKTLFEPAARIPQTRLMDPSTTEPIRHRYKIARRQFNRLLEMALLSTIEPRHRSTNRITRKSQASDPQDRQYYFWRLLVKTRLLWQNRDTLMQLDAPERVPKLEETLAGLQEEYERLLRGFERRKADGLAATATAGAERDAEANGGSKEALSVRKKKRKVVDDEDDEDEDDGSRTPLKKVKA